MADKPNMNPSQAEQASYVEGITAGVLCERFGAGWNPKIARWQFPDGSTGMFDNHGKESPSTGKHYYPFIPAAAPLTFPDEATDASVDLPVQRNRRGEPVTPLTANEPEYTGEHADNFGQGMPVRRERPVEPERKVHRLTKD